MEQLPKDTSIVVLTHIYYGYTEGHLKESLLNLKKYNCDFIFNINERCLEKEQSILGLKKDFPSALIIQTSNIGKDVGGKLAMIDLMLRTKLKPDFCILLHDKKSPHTPLGETWSKKLFRIVENDNIDAVIELLKKDKKTGVVSAKEFITNEFDKSKNTFNSTCDDILRTLLSKYDFKLKSYDFVGGTIFWMRYEILASFFNKHPALTIRAGLEKGNVMDNETGTNTHAWERLLSWIALDQGYFIKGI